MFTTLKIWYIFTFLLRFSWPSIYIIIIFFSISFWGILPHVETTLKWIVSLNLMQGSLSHFSIFILKINSRLKPTLCTKCDSRWGETCTRMCRLENFLANTKKNGMCVLRFLHHKQKCNIWECSLSFCNNKNAFNSLLDF